MIVSITNQKGGVGKSTTAQALAAGLFLKGKKVLLIDLDPQANITSTTRADDSGATSYEIMKGEATAEEAIIPIDYGDLIPSSRQLTSIDLELMTTTGKEYRIAEALEGIRGRYDYIILDTPPALGLLTVAAMTASDTMIIPAQADAYSLQGIGQLQDTIQSVRKYTNKNLQIEGVLVTRYNKRTILSRDMRGIIEGIAEQIGTNIYQAVIRECIALKEAQAVRQDIFTYSPRSNAAADYGEFIQEFTNRSKAV